MKKTLLLACLSALLFASSCNKIVENKVDGTWKMSTAKRNGADYTFWFQIAFSNYTLVLNKNGTFTEDYGATHNSGSWSVTLKGKAINLNQSNGVLRVYYIKKGTKDVLDVTTTTLDGYSDEYNLVR